MIELTLPLPPSLNHMYRRFARSVTTTQAVKDYHDRVWAEIMAKYGQRPKLQMPLRLTMNMTVGDKWRHDLDNTLKVGIDALAGVLGFDDNGIVEIRASKQYVKGAENQIEVRLETIEEARR